MRVRRRWQEKEWKKQAHASDGVISVPKGFEVFADQWRLPQVGRNNMSVRLPNC